MHAHVIDGPGYHDYLGGRSRKENIEVTIHNGHRKAVIVIEPRFGKLEKRSFHVEGSVISVRGLPAWRDKTVLAQFHWLDNHMVGIVKLKEEDA